MEYRELSEQEYRDLQSRILYEDNHLLVVNKRCGEIVQGDKTGDETLADAYKAFIARRDGKPGKVFMGIPHRLDRPVSGITVLAKTSKCLERMNEAFRNGAPAIPLSGAHRALPCLGGCPAYRPASPDPLPAGRHRLSHQRRPEIWRPAVQSRRRHLPARPKHPLCPPRPEKRNQHHRSPARILERGRTLYLAYK